MAYMACPQMADAYVTVLPARKQAQPAMVRSKRPDSCTRLVLGSRRRWCVGGLALQFARLRNVRVLATASGEDGLAFAKRLGAAAVVDGRRADLVDAAKAHERMEAGHVLGKIVLRVRQRHGLR